jgi:hypothetical protein
MRRKFADLGVIVVDCCSVEKEVIQKGSKKIYDFLSRGSRDRGIGRHAGSARVVAKNGIYRMQYLEFSNEREITTTSKNVYF